MTKRFSLLFTPSWSVLFFITAMSVYIYSFMEWIFFVTKPSFMSGMSFWLQIRIYLLSALGMSVIPLLIILLFGVVDRLVRTKIVTQFLIALGILVPSLIVSTLTLMLLDNFTYTVFKFGVVSTERVMRAIYGLFFICITGYTYYRNSLYIAARNRKTRPVKRNQWILLSGFISLSVLLSLYSILISRSGGLSSEVVSQTDSLPNIILLGSDGLDSVRLSAYGYERDTTPNIKGRLLDALVAENAFPNGGTTAGSVASILTGKLPIETRVIYPPDILIGEDSYQHLTGILKRTGYRTVDLSVPYFGDALTLNIQGGFDIANQRSGADNAIVKISRTLSGGDSAYFVDSMLQRISDRLLHIFFIKPMINPIEAVIEPSSRADEQKRFNDLISTLESSQFPVFVHVHMLGTHGPRFEIREQVFSAGQTQDGNWMMDFYDDSILNFDHYVGELFDYLADSGKLKNTIVIVYSDHGRRWTIHNRVPLIFWFPEGEHAGNITMNVQNIDIAPTVLDYLGIPIPAWMRGQSLLNNASVEPQYIFNASVESSLIEISTEGFWIVDAERKKPPFYQVGYVGLIVCDQWFELYLQNPGMLYGNVNGHTQPCSPGSLLTSDEAEAILLNHLLQNGFDISSFPSSISVQRSE